MMRTSALEGVILFGLGGSLLLYSISYVVRDAIVTGIPLSVFSLGTFIGGLSFLMIGIGLYYLLERAPADRLRPKPLTTEAKILILGVVAVIAASIFGLAVATIPATIFLGASAVLLLYNRWRSRKSADTR